MSKTQKVKLSDYYRVLLSETAPFDVPLIFSNNHFYSRMRSYKDSEPEVKLLIERIFTRTLDTSYCPIKYPILKGEDSCRYLSLLHPASQLHIVELYKKYSDRLLHHCSVGSFSIRRPKKVASTVSIKSSISDSRAFRSDAASTVSDEKKFKHSTSYFSYSPHTKLHQFFGSPEYFKLESKFTHFWSIDISKCFDSIYTHSITWAVKGKKFSKTTSSDTDFTNILDRIMQSSNYNETNGIVIGNEFSRIFAEIILQDVDEKVENLASSEGLTAGKDYEIKRYVDDYFIFCSSEGLARKVVAILEECLRAYKFHLNTSKTKKRSRPLITGITRAKIKTDEAIKEIFQIIFSIEDSEKFITKSLIRDPNAVSRKFLNLIMNASYEDSEAYLTMCGYVISSIFNALKTLNYREDDEDSEHSYNAKNAMYILLSVAFHLFNMNPNSANSVKISLVCYLMISSFVQFYPDEADSIKLMVSNFVKEFFESGKFTQLRDRVRSFAPIEFSNILCVARNLCPEMLLPPNLVKQAFSLDELTERSQLYLDLEESTDYFQIMSALYYCGNDREYELIKKDIIKNISVRISSLDNISTDARVCYLFLDSMSCPFIDLKTKKRWFEDFYKVSRFAKDDSSSEVKEAIFKELTESQWFISWDRLELWNILERKELLFGY